MFSGSYVALVTPFEEDGKVDWEALLGLIEWQRDSGTDGLVLCGSTGEGSSLSIEERLEVFRVAKGVGGSMTLIGSTGTNRTAESVELTEEAMAIGLDGCMAVVPYYNRPMEAGCLEHFRAIARVGLPLMVYHHPGRTGVKLSVEGLSAIGALEGVVAIKEASGDLPYATEVFRKSEVPLFSGDDNLLLAQMAIGFAGSISIVANAVPKEWRELIQKGLSGDFLGARELFFALYSKIAALGLETNPQCIKYALHVMGRCGPKMRLPLMEPSREVRARLLDEFGNERCPAGLVGRT